MQKYRVYVLIEVQSVYGLSLSSAAHAARADTAAKAVCEY
jgi:hypothetical protein